jgi:hypothetical protein
MSKKASAPGPETSNLVKPGKSRTPTRSRTAPTSVATAFHQLRSRLNDSVCSLMLELGRILLELEKGPACREGWTVSGRVPGQT